MKHLVDFVWMRKGAEKPIRVTATVEEISVHMVAGYVQVLDEPGEKNQDPKEREEV
jgi:hypothetical protein